MIVDIDEKIEATEVEAAIFEQYQLYLRSFSKKLTKKIDEATDRSIDRIEKVFVCEQCGRCCEEKYGVSLSGMDINKMSKKLGIDKKEFFRKYVTIVGTVPCMAVNKRCEFQNEDLTCSMYDSRPLACKRYPCKSTLFRYSVFVSICNFLRGRSTTSPMVCPSIPKIDQEISDITTEEVRRVMRRY